jgi:hypothetical protein
MKKILLLIATISFAFGACERHPADQLPKKDEGGAKQEAAKPAESPEKQEATKPAESPASSPAETPKNG